MPIANVRVYFSPTIHIRIVSVQCNGLTYPSGRVETVVITRDISHLFSSWPPQSNASDPQDALDHGLAVIDEDACLFLVSALTSSTNNPSVIGGWLDILEA